MDLMTALAFLFTCKIHYHSAFSFGWVIPKVRIWLVFRGSGFTIFGSVSGLKLTVKRGAFEWLHCFTLYRDGGCDCSARCVRGSPLSKDKLTLWNIPHSRFDYCSFIQIPANKSTNANDFYQLLMDEIVRFLLCLNWFPAAGLLFYFLFIQQWLVGSQLF